MPNSPKRALYRSVSVTFDGNTYHGTFSIAGGMVRVESAYGVPMSTELGTFPPEMTARLLLLEILEGAKYRGAL